MSDDAPSATARETAPGSIAPRHNYWCIGYHDTDGTCQTVLPPPARGEHHQHHGEGNRA